MRYNSGFIGIDKTPTTNNQQGVHTAVNQFLLRKLGTWTGAPAVSTSDTYFNYTTLLLPGDGTNGAQNNTFLDSSSSPLTITRNGDTTQGTFSPFSQTGWSLGGCTGSSDYLQMGSSAALQLGTGDFTVECWAYFTTVGSSGGSENVIMDVRPTGTNGAYFNFGLSNQTVYWDNGTGSFTTSTVSLNTWLHIAIVRNSGTTSIYINGTSLASTSDSVNYSCGSTNRIANLSYFSSGDRQFNGNISNLRIVKGTAVYTAAFTPPTGPLTAISGTTLLTLQSNRWIDNSSSALPISVNGAPTVQAFSPFNPTAAYSAATVGGSGYFDGSGDYLTVPDNAAFTLGSGDFTIECWAYWTGSGQQRIIAQADSSGNNVSFVLGTTSANKAIGRVLVSTTAYDATSSADLVVNQWNHIAFVRNGSTLRLYINGVQDGTNGTISTQSVFDSSYQVGIGRPGELNAEYFKGYVASLRFVKGTCVYPSGTTFTPPTAPLTAITNTSLLLNFTNAGIIDSTAKNDLVTVGNAQISTTQSKFGGASMYFDGTGDYLIMPTAESIKVGGGDFTIEFWLYWASSLTPSVYWASSTSSILITDSAATYAVICSSTDTASGYSKLIDAPSSLSANTWGHVAVVRSSGTTKIYLNGAVGGNTSSITGSFDCAYIGYQKNGGRALNGYIDDLRITKGIARYTSSFTPPSAAFLL